MYKFESQYRLTQLNIRGSDNFRLLAEHYGLIDINDSGVIITQIADLNIWPLQWQAITEDMTIMQDSRVHFYNLRIHSCSPYASPSIFTYYNETDQDLLFGIFEVYDGQFKFNLLYNAFNLGLNLTNNIPIIYYPQLFVVIAKPIITYDSKICAYNTDHQLSIVDFWQEDNYHIKTYLINDYNGLYHHTAINQLSNQNLMIYRQDQNTFFYATRRGLYFVGELPFGCISVSPNFQFTISNIALNTADYILSNKSSQRRFSGQMLATFFSNKNQAIIIFQLKNKLIAQLVNPDNFELISSLYIDYNISLASISVWNNNVYATSNTFLLWTDKNNDLFYLSFDRRQFQIISNDDPVKVRYNMRNNINRFSFYILDNNLIYLIDHSTDYINITTAYHLGNIDLGLYDLYQDERWIEIRQKLPDWRNLNLPVEVAHQVIEEMYDA